MPRPVLRPSRAETYRRLFGLNHPMLPIALTMTGPSTIIGLLRYLQNVACDPLAATPEVLESWLASARTGGGRSTRVYAARELYREAFAAGLIPSDPTAGLHYRRRTARVEYRVSDEDLQLLLSTTGAAAKDPLTRLAAVRDTAMLLLFAWRPISREELRVLLWSDVQLFAGSGSICLAAGWVVMPAPVARAVLAFRDALDANGAAPVDDDALLPALGKRVETWWRATERPLLAPMEHRSVATALKRRMRRAGLSLPAGTRTMAKPIWLYRDGRPFEPRISAAPMAMRRVATSPAVLFRRYPQRDEDGDGADAEVA